MKLRFRYPQHLQLGPWAGSSSIHHERQAYKDGWDAAIKAMDKNRRAPRRES